MGIASKLYASCRFLHSRRFHVQKKENSRTSKEVFLRHDDGEVARGWAGVIDLYLRRRYGSDRIEDFAHAFPPIAGVFDTGHAAIEMRVIGDTDPRRHQRGLNTVIARRRIPRGEVLSEYAGTALQFNPKRRLLRIPIRTLSDLRSVASL
jgi:hypothetical protein